MKVLTLRALVAVAVAAAAAMFAIKATERRRALSAGPVVTEDPPEDVFAESVMGDVATGEGMPEAG
jgi:hypothetical protein